MKDNEEGQEDVGSEKQSQPHLQVQQRQYREVEEDDEGYEEEEEEDESSEDGEDNERVEEDGDYDHGKVAEEKDSEALEKGENNSVNGYTELFQLITNIARMKAFDESVGNREQGNGLGRGAGWYHGVRYLGFREFLESHELEDGGSATRSEHGCRGEIEEEEGEMEEGEENEAKEENKHGEEQEEEKQKEENDDGYESEDEYEDELEYVIVRLPGEETDLDDESWCLVEKENDTSKHDKQENNIESNKEDSLKQDDNTKNAEWHEYNCRHCHSYTIRIYTSGITSTSTPTFQADIIQPQPRPEPQPTPDEEQIPLLLPSIKISQTSPTSFTILLAIPSCKRKDVTVAYDPDANVLRLSGVLYSDIFSEPDTGPISSSPSSSSSLDTDAESEGEKSREMETANAGRGDDLDHTSSDHKLSGQARTSFRESTTTYSSFEAELELWLAYDRRGESTWKPESAGSLDADPNSNSFPASSGGEGNKDGDNEDTVEIGSEKDNSQSQSQSQSQSRSTTIERILVGRFYKIINFVADMPTPTTSSASPSDEPEEQQQPKEVVD